MIDSCHQIKVMLQRVTPSLETALSEYGTRLSLFLMVEKISSQLWVLPMIQTYRTKLADWHNLGLSLCESLCAPLSLCLSLPSILS